LPPPLDRPLAAQRRAAESHVGVVRGSRDRAARLPGPARQRPAGRHPSAL